MSNTADIKMSNITGIEDIYLTKNPEVSFFKKNYKRYSNFATEIKKISLDNTARYGDNITITIDRIGDLLHKSYMEVSIPLISMKDNIITNTEYFDKKNNELKNLQTQINTYDTLYNNLKDFASMEIDIYRFATNILLSQNLTTTYIKSIVLNYSNKYNETREQKIIVLDNSIVNSINLLDYFNNLDLTKSLETIQTELNNINKNLINKLNLYFKRKEYYNKKYNEINNGTINYCWAKYLGHMFFEYFEIEIGGLVVDRYSRDSLHIHNIKNIMNDMVEMYNKMIGNVDELNLYYSIKENTYKLYIPLIFWFTKDSLHSLPLVSMKYSDVIIRMKISKLQDILYFKDIDMIYEKLMIVDVPITLDNNGSIIINSNLKYNKLEYIKDINFIRYYCSHINSAFLDLKFPNMDNNTKTTILSYNTTNELTKDDYIRLISNSNDITNCRYELLGMVGYYDFNYMYSLVKLPTINLLAEYVYVDTNERNHFASNKLVYMIETYNENIFDVDNKMLFSNDLDFTNLLKEMMWFFRPDGFNNGRMLYDKKNLLNYNIEETFLKDFNIYINDFKMLNLSMINNNYYNYAEPYKYNNNVLPLGVYMKSFSLHPNRMQPSGGVNFTYLKGKNVKLEIFQDFLNKYYNSSYNYMMSKLKLIFINRAYNLFIVEKGSGRIIFSN